MVCTFILTCMLPKIQKSIVTTGHTFVVKRLIGDMQFYVTLVNKTD